MATAEVRSYLERHRINKLFEDLMSNVVKEQPEDPVTFLITVLRAKQGKKSPSSRLTTPTVSSTLKGRGGLQVTGAAVDATKQPSGPRLSKSSANIRSSSASVPHRATLASTSTPNVTARPSTAAGLEGTLNSPRKKTGHSKTPTKAGVSQVRPSPARPLVGSPHTAAKPRGPDSGLQRKSVEKSTKKKQVSKQGEGKPPATPTRQCSVLLPQEALSTSSSERTVDEFFGETAAFTVEANTSDDEDDDMPHEPSAQGGQCKKGGVGSPLDGVDDEVISAYMRCRQLKQSRHGNKDHLAQLLVNKMADTEVVADSSGYNSSGEEDSEASEGTPLELYECPGDLLEEGIECSSPSHVLQHNTSRPNQGDVLIKVAICAKCARAISAVDEGVSDITSLSAANTSGQEELFESASQVGSTVSYPQWDPEGGTKMSMVQMWGLSSRGGAANDQSDDGSTVVSRQTADSWGGLAPPQRSTPYAPSETGTESTAMAPLEGTPWGKTAAEGTLAQRWASK